MANTKDFKVKNGIQPTVYHEGVGTVTSSTNYFDLANAELLTETVNLNTLHGNIDKINIVTFTPDGTKLIVGAKDSLSANAPRVFLYEFNLGTAWDISTITSSSAGENITSETTQGVYGFAWNSDGTKFFVSGGGGDIFEYNTSTAYSVGSADVTYAGASEAFDTTTDTGSNSRGIVFFDSGNKFLIASVTNDAIYEYGMTSPYDISTATLNQSKDISADINNPWNLSFNSDGTVLYVLNDGNLIYTCDLTTAYDISTLSVTTSSSTGQFGGIEDSAMFFKPDGSKLYLGTTTETVKEYNITSITQTLDMSTGSVFEITPTSDIEINLSNPAASGTVSQATLLLDQAGYGGYDLGNASYSGKSFGVSSQETSPYGMTFNNDGTKMYIIGQGTDQIYQYSLSTAFDLDTASYDSVSFNVQSQNSAAAGVAFNSDGTKMYMLGYSSPSSVFQYSLSTAFDLSTASYDSVSFNVSSQASTAFGLAFNNAGTKMYIVSFGNDTIYQYSLSSAFNLSTASYDSVSLDVNAQEAAPAGMTFNNDGTKMYIVGENGDEVNQYGLSIAFDLSTASYDNIAFSLSSQESTPSDIAFNNDGTKMYMVGYNTDTIYQYSTATPATITYPSTLEFEEGTAPTSPAIGETDVIAFSTRDGGTSYQAAQAVDGAL